MNAREAEYAVRAALETLENADTEYSYWMKQYKHHVGDVSDWVNAASADEDDSAPRYRLLQQLLQDTRYGLESQGTTLSSLKRRRGRELEFLVPCKRKKYPKGFRWEDKTMHFFPKDMKIPICTLSTMWVYWLCGDAVANYPPYRILTPPDLESEAMRRLLSSLRFVMLEIETRVLEKGAWANYPTPKEAADMLGTVIESLSVRPNKTRQNLLPVGNLKWTSLGRIIRDQRKLLDEAESGGGSEDGEDN
ncbi:hypothetical protein BBJ29_004595 [Phytophthora kernoviae]|uniref:Uncharacterized protein n=1 Tax=Phytophthora kernoviae TaxID=325452 RepID=A0A3F2RJE0_9STRA|nr:hypothetical protein BBP00_00007047 [Phytophthora kernoviae]RLN70457.1 hypothetical protein BBJ29_004595 [Phytophthora kernoviae]